MNLYEIHAQNFYWKWTFNNHNMNEEHKFLIAGVNVPFPHEKPYAAQMALMSGVIRSMRNGQNAILESPTGTGKSAALLAAALAYQKHLKETTIEPPGKIDPPVIKSYLGFFPPLSLVNSQQEIFSPLLTKGMNPDQIPRYPTTDKIDSSSEYTTDFIVKQKQHKGQIWYATRTHQQLKQLVREMKKLPFHPQMVIMASRAQVCINPKVMNCGDVDGKCSDLAKYGGCPYDKTNKIPKEFKPFGSHDKFEIEDLKDWCRRYKGCPYVISRRMMMAADIVFCPYNYFLDPKIKGQMQLDLSGVYLIIDEAHNIENSCRDGGTFHQSRDKLDWSLMYIRTQLKKFPEDTPRRRAFLIVLDLLVKQFQWFDGITKMLRSQGKKEYVVPDNAALYDTWSLNQSTYPRLVAAFDCIFKFSNSMNFPDQYGDLDKVPMMLGGQLEQQWVMYALTMKNNYAGIKDYCIAVTINENDQSQDTFHGLNLNPGAVFNWPSREAHSVILASGTLTPLETFEDELGVKFPIRLSAPHVIDPSQVIGFTITETPNGTAMSSTHAVLEGDGQRQNINKALGEIFLNFLPVIPNGVLFFVTSHSFLMQMLDTWKRFGIYDAIDQIKPIFYEMPDSEPEFFANYKAAASSGTGAFLIGVFRGRSSEGIDFIDEQARAVFAFGIPFPMAYDLEVRLKREYNDSKFKNGGSSWYDAQAYRALFQAIGRCIRHRNDYGAVILIDKRFPNELQRFPKWLKNNIKVGVLLNHIKSQLAQFYNNMMARFPHKFQIKPESPTDFYCADCGQKIIECTRVHNGQTFPVIKSGVKELTGAGPEDDFFLIRRLDLANASLSYSDNVYYEDDKSAYERACCSCGACIGVRVHASTYHEKQFIGGIICIVERLRVQVGKILVDILPTQRKVIKMGSSQLFK